MTYFFTYIPLRCTSRLMRPAMLKPVAMPTFFQWFNTTNENLEASNHGSYNKWVDITQLRHTDCWLALRENRTPGTLQLQSCTRDSQNEAAATTNNARAFSRLARIRNLAFQWAHFSIRDRSSDASKSLQPIPGRRVAIKENLGLPTAISFSARHSWKKRGKALATAPTHCPKFTQKPTARPWKKYKKRSKRQLFYSTLLGTVSMYFQAMKSKRTPPTARPPPFSLSV